MNLKLLAGKNIGSITGTGNLNPGALNAGSGQAVRELFNTTISTILGFMTIIAALYFLFQIVIAGYGILTAGGDSGQVGTNRERLTNGLIGLSVIIAAYAIIGLLGKMFGIDTLNPFSFLP